MLVSFSQQGNPYDNARAEAGWSSLKTELLPHGGAFTNLEEALPEATYYLDTYFNLNRRHSALGYRSPHQFERDFQLNLSYLSLPSVFTGQLQHPIATCPLPSPTYGNHRKIYQAALQWSKYSFLLALVIQAKPLIGMLISAGILTSAAGLLSLVILQPFSLELLSVFLTVVLGGMVLLGRMLWRDIRYQQVASPWPIFLCVGLAGTFGGLAVLTKPQDALHFMLFTVLVFGSLYLLKLCIEWAA